MAYYPPSQIKTNLYTGGAEFVVEKSKQEYIGYYYALSDGTFYSGKNPNNKPNDKLIYSVNNPGDIQQDAEVDAIGASGGERNLYILPYQYKTSTKLKFAQNPPSSPVEEIVKPTRKQYEIGEYQRYFLKKINELKIIEVNITQFKRYTQKQTNVNYQLYVPFAISWVISGDRSLAFNSNKGAVERAERNSNILGLISYFANDYLQYYQYTNGDILTDLTTDGTEYKLEKTGKPYTGLYHIHPDKGPMVGAKHVKTPHDYLVPIKQFITPKRMVSTRNVRSAPMARRTFRSGGGY